MALRDRKFPDFNVLVQPRARRATPFVPFPTLPLLLHCTLGNRRRDGARQNLTLALSNRSSSYTSGLSELPARRASSRDTLLNLIVFGSRSLARISAQPQAQRLEYIIVKPRNSTRQFFDVAVPTNLKTTKNLSKYQDKMDFFSERKNMYKKGARRTCIYLWRAIGVSIASGSLFRLSQTLFSSSPRVSEPAELFPYPRILQTFYPPLSSRRPTNTLQHFLLFFISSFLLSSFTSINLYARV